MRFFRGGYRADIVCLDDIGSAAGAIQKDDGPILPGGAPGAGRGAQQHVGFGADGGGIGKGDFGPDVGSENAGAPFGGQCAALDLDKGGLRGLRGGIVLFV